MHKDDEKIWKNEELEKNSDRKFEKEKNIKNLTKWGKSDKI